MNRFRPLALGVFGIVCMLFVAGCGDEDEDEAYAKELKVYTPNGQVTMRYLDEVEGKGPPIKSMDEVLVHYTGWLTNGKKFDSSVDRKEPFPVVVGAGKVIKGWDEGLIGMKEGGKRKLFIPPALGYGDKAQGTTIPANSKIIFEVEVLKILEPGTVAELEQQRMQQQMMRQMQMQQRR